MILAPVTRRVYDERLEHATKSAKTLYLVVIAALIVAILAGCPLSAGHTIIAFAIGPGTIDPSGEVRVRDGEDQEFTMVPDLVASIDDVFVDGESIGPVSSYTFSAVDTYHTIYVLYSSNVFQGEWIGSSRSAIQTFTKHLNAPISTFVCITKHLNTPISTFECISALAAVSSGRRLSFQTT